MTLFFVVAQISDQTGQEEVVWIALDRVHAVLCVQRLKVRSYIREVTTDTFVGTKREKSFYFPFLGGA